jgi:hypothetical protein
MRTSLQCLAKAIEFDALSATALTEVEGTDYEQIANAWREIAAMAAW